MAGNKSVSLITGASGFVGANLARRLLIEGHEVHCFLRSNAQNWRLDDISENIIMHFVDIRDESKVKTSIKKIKPQHIFHLATAGVYGGTSIKDRGLFEVNIIGLINLLDAVRAQNFQSFINTGSSSEYGITSESMREDNREEPANVYGITKLAATHYARFYAIKESLPIVTLRLFSPYGPYDHESRFMSNAMVPALKGQRLTFGDPNSVRDFVYIDDVVDAYFLSMKKALTYKGEVFNIGSGVGTSLKDAADYVREIIDFRGEIIWNQSEPRTWESSRWQADITKARNFIGWEPKISFREGLIRTAEWFKNNLVHYNNIK